MCAAYLYPRTLTEYRIQYTVAKNILLCDIIIAIVFILSYMVKMASASPELMLL